MTTNTKQQQITIVVGLIKNGAGENFQKNLKFYE